MAIKLLSCHATSAVTDHNWSLWGRLCTSARSALDMEHAKSMIAICAHEEGKVTELYALDITLDVIEEDV